MNQMEGLQYTLIARGTNVVLESGTENAEGFDALARRLPAQLIHLGAGTRKTYTHEGKCFHCVVVSPDSYDEDHSLVIIVTLAAGTFSPERSFMFLTDVSKTFTAYRPPTSVQTLQPDYKGFDFQLRERMHFYSTDTSIEKVREAQRRVDDTRRVMMENIDLSINRGEKLDVLAGKIEDMNAKSYSFRTQAKKAKRAFCWQNTRRCCLVFSVFFVLFLILCGVGIYFLFKYAPWKPHHHSSSSGHIESSSSSAHFSSSASL